MNLDHLASARPGGIQVVLAPRSVLLTEDRAQVIRRGIVPWPGGSGVLAVPGLSPVTVDSTLQVQATHVATGASLLIARTALRRRWIEPQRPSEAAMIDLFRLVRDKDDELGSLQARQARLRAALAALQDEAALYASLLVRNVCRGLSDQARWEADAEGIRQRQTRIMEEILSLDEQIQDLQEERIALDVERAGPAPGPTILGTWAELALEGPAGDIQVELRYLVPSALWRPSYEALLVQGPTPMVEWRVMGTVWQRTGEDWEDVEITLSTARPSAGATLPPLLEDRLQLRDKTPQERSTVVATFQDQEIRTTSRTGGAPEALPGVDDGGETRTWSPPGRVHLPSDGRPHRVMVGGFREPASLRQVCHPELRSGVFRKMALRNRFASPLLAGPVVLVLDGGFTGLGEIPYIAPGEAFELSLGSQDDVAVTLERTRRVEERLAQSDLTWFVQRCALTHTGDSPLPTELVMRVPVSDLEGVHVVLDVQHSTRGYEGPDKEGHLRWRPTLQPNQTAYFEIQFRLDKPGRVQLADPW